MASFISGPSSYLPSSPVLSKGKEPEDDIVDWENLTPAEQYRISVEKIQATIQEAGWRPKIRRQASIPEEIWNVVALEPQFPLTSAGAIIGATALPVALNSTRQIRGRGWKEVVSSGLPYLAWGAAIGAGLAAVGGSVYMYTTRYSNYRTHEEEVLALTQNLFQLLRDPQTSRQALSQAIIALSDKRAESSLERLFNVRYPDEMYQFLMARGIVSESESNHDQAQQIYLDALSSPRLIYRANEPALRHLFLYLLARSLRVSGHPEQSQQYVDQIPENSPIFPLGQIEREAIIPHSNAFDEEDLPFKFRCPLSLQIMEQPVYHERDGHRYYYEREYIEDWLQYNPIDPNSRAPLLHPLQPDPQLALSIGFWKLTQLRSES